MQLFDMNLSDTFHINVLFVEDNWNEINNQNKILISYESTI